jgi:hypothetical protein
VELQIVASLDSLSALADADLFAALGYRLKQSSEGVYPTKISGAIDVD